MYRSLLVPLDGSPFGEHALPLALAIARRAGSTIQLVNVAVPLAEAYAEGIFVAPTDLQSEYVKQQHTYLGGVADRLRARAAVEVRTLVLEGEVASTLRVHAEASKASLVVMATHGRGALGRFWLGSVADDLVRHLSQPLLLVRPEEEAPDLGIEPDLSHILLPLDGTELAEQMLGPALELASMMPAAEVILMRVVKPATHTPYYPPEAGMDREAQALLREMRVMQDRLHREAEEYLAKVAGRVREKGLRVRTHVAVEGQPAVAILNEAKREGTGVIALATHGRRGLARLMLGSVADKVIRAAHGPVLVLRPK
jgi:nucleotide-binding universal stress UspA family protein